MTSALRSGILGSGLVAVAVLSGAAAAPAGQGSPFAPVCPNANPVGPDTLRLAIYVGPLPGRLGHTKDAPGRLGSTAAARFIAESFEAPTAMAVAQPIAWLESGADRERPTTFPLLEATLELSRAAPDKPLSAHFRIPTGSEILNHTVRAAAMRADSLGEFRELLPGDPADTVRLHVGGAPTVPDSGFGLFRVSVAYYRADEAVRPIEQPSPQHPAPGIDDAVDLRYVVDAHGRAVPHTIEIVRGRYREMAEEAIRVIKESRYSPARHKSCSVAQLVYQRITFHEPQ